MNHYHQETEIDAPRCAMTEMTRFVHLRHMRQEIFEYGQKSVGYLRFGPFRSVRTHVECKSDFETAIREPRMCTYEIKSLTSPNRLASQEYRGFSVKNVGSDIFRTLEKYLPECCPVEIKAISIGIHTKILRLEDDDRSRHAAGVVGIGAFDLSILTKRPGKGGLSGEVVMVVGWCNIRVHVR